MFGVTNRVTYPYMTKLPALWGGSGHRYRWRGDPFAVFGDEVDQKFER